MDVYLAVEHALSTPVGSLYASQLVDTALIQNPHLDGANVADILAMYDDHDGCLWFTDPLLERFGAGWQKVGIKPEFYRVAAIAVALAESPRSEVPLENAGAMLLGMRMVWLIVELLAREAQQRAAIAEGIDRAVKDV